MTSDQISSIKDPIDNPVSNNEIDLRAVWNSVYRNKIFIASCAALGLIISGIYAFSSKRTWQGEFQIVIQNRKTPNSINATSAKTLADLTGPSNSSLNTEIEILKSPSVLLTVFDFLKEQKNIKNNSTKNLRFNEWKKNSLKIGLQKNTSVLNITYRDTDKDIILPILRKISVVYQTYSGRNRRRFYKLGVDYFEKQISFYKTKSADSFRIAQLFSKENDMQVEKINSSKEAITPYLLDIEIVSAKAKNEVKSIDNYLTQIRNSDPTDNIQIIYLASKIPTLDSLISQLNDIESSLARKKVIFKENDRVIKNLIKSKNQTIGLLRKNLINYLISKREENLLTIESSKRPEGVIIKYKQLLFESAKDNIILNNLEKQYRTILLDQARTEDPWELITKPTLRSAPIAPERKKIVALGLIWGILIGFILSMLNDKKKDIIYKTERLEELTKLPLLTTISVNKKELFSESMDLIASGPLSEISGKIALIPVGNINDLTLSLLNQNLIKFSKNCEFLIANDLREIKKCQNVLLITALGVTKGQDLTEIKNKLLLLDKPMLGFITLTDIKIE